MHFGKQKRLIVTENLQNNCLYAKYNLRDIRKPNPCFTLGLVSLIYCN